MPTQHELDKHTAEEHARSPFSQYLKEIVYGGIDGIITTFAVVAGFSGAEISSGMTTIPVLSVLLFGLANLFADATSMGLGNFLSVRADKDVYTKEQTKERREIRTGKDFEEAETIQLLKEKGFSTTQAQDLTKIFVTNEDYWVEVMMRDEMHMPSPQEDNPVLTGFATFGSFVIFGSIPLLPYLTPDQSPVQLFSYSLYAATIALVILGIFRWKITHQKFVRSILETILVGAISSLVAYGVGTFFSV